MSASRGSEGAAARRESRARAIALAVSLALAAAPLGAACNAFLREEHDRSKIQFLSEECLRVLSDWDRDEASELRRRFPELGEFGETDFVYDFLRRFSSRASATMADLAASRCPHPPDGHGTMPPGYPKPIEEFLRSNQERMIVEITKVTSGFAPHQVKISSLLEFRVVERLGLAPQRQGPSTGSFMRPYGFLAVGTDVACESPGFGHRMAQPGDQFLLLGRWSQVNPGYVPNALNLRIEKGKIQVRDCALCSGEPELSLDEVRTMALDTSAVPGRADP